MADVGTVAVWLIALSGLVAVGGVLLKIFLIFRIVKMIAIPAAIAMSLGIGAAGTSTETGSGAVEKIARFIGYERFEMPSE